MQVSGKIKLIKDTEQISDKFKKRELVIETADQYPQFLLIQFTQDRCDVLEAYNEGEEVEIGINLRGREWTNPQGEVKYFNTLEGWRITRANEGQSNQPAEQPQPTEEEGGDLPF